MDVFNLYFNRGAFFEILTQKCAGWDGTEQQVTGTFGRQQITHNSIREKMMMTQRASPGRSTPKAFTGLLKPTLRLGMI